MISTNVTPEIARKMVINRFQEVRCPLCRNVYQLGDLKPALFLEMIGRGFRPPDNGGNGYNYYCPKDKTLIYAPRW
jgi:hypothetical protein